MGVIASKLGSINESIAYYELCIEIKLQHRSPGGELMKCYELLGFECQKGHLVELAQSWF